MNAWTRRTGWGVLGVIVAVVVVAIVIALLYGGKALPGTTIGSFAVGGQTQSQISDALARRTATMKELRYSYDGKPIAIPGEDIGLQIDVSGSAEAAVRAGKGNPFETVASVLRAFVVDRDSGLQYAVNDNVLQQKLMEATEGYTEPAVNAGVVRDGTAFHITQEKPGQTVDAAANAWLAHRAIEHYTTDIPLYIRPQRPDIKAATLAPARAYAQFLANTPFTVKAVDREFTPDAETLASWVTFRRHEPGTEFEMTLIRSIDVVMGVGQVDEPIIGGSSRTLHAGVEPKAVGQYVAAIAPEVDHPPVNARVRFENGQLLVAGAAQNGIVIDREQAVKAIADGMVSAQRVATLSLHEKAADIRPETLSTLKITSKIGSSTTTFAGSPYGRIYNIGVGASKFDSELIKPGEEFSFNTVLGDVGPETGYVPELVIKENKTVPEYGGGLCQVSTTMFRAAMSAGLPITDRSNHSYAVHYYAPIGMDATIYPPNPDMKFVNNTPGYILVQTHQEGVSLTFDFYGMSDGRTSDTQILYINASEANGGTAAFKYTVTGGAQPLEKVFTSTYLPHSQFPISRSLN